MSLCGVCVAGRRRRGQTNFVFLLVFPRKLWYSVGQDSEGGGQGGGRVHQLSCGEREGGAVEQIAAQLKKRGITYWYSETGVAGGEDFASTVPRQINACKVFLLMVDEDATKSLFVQNELGLAFKRMSKGEDITILPFLVGECAFSDWMSFYLVHTQRVNNRDKLIERIAELVPPSVPLVRETPTIVTPPPRILWTRETISAGGSHTVGLRKNGTVVAVGLNLYGRCDVSNWRDMVAVSAGYQHTVGLRKDGTVVAVGSNGAGQCDVSDWRDMEAVSAGTWHTVGLRKDGAVVAVGLNDCKQCNVSDWRDIAAVAAGRYHTVGLRKDGTVVAVGSNGAGQCDVSDWRDIQLP